MRLKCPKESPCSKSCKGQKNRAVFRPRKLNTEKGLGGEGEKNSLGEGKVERKKKPSGIPKGAVTKKGQSTLQQKGNETPKETTRREEQERFRRKASVSIRKKAQRLGGGD